MCETLTMARFAFVTSSGSFVKHFRKFKNQNEETEKLIGWGAAFLTRRSLLVNCIFDLQICYETKKVYALLKFGGNFLKFWVCRASCGVVEHRDSFLSLPFSPSF